MREQAVRIKQLEHNQIMAQLAEVQILIWHAIVYF